MSKSDSVSQRPVKSLSPVMLKNGSTGYDTVRSLLKLIKNPHQGEIIHRLLRLPLSDRADALLLQLTLSYGGIELSRNEWQELWDMVSRRAVESPRNEEDLKELFSRDENYSYASGTDETEKNQCYRIFREARGRGSVSVQLEENKLVNLFIRMETKTRKWEFHLTARGKNRNVSTLSVFTNDEKLVKDPPREWDILRRSLKKYQIRTERAIKLLRNDSLLTDNENRELNHLVDIIL